MKLLNSSHITPPSDLYLGVAGCSSFQLWLELDNLQHYPWVVFDFLCELLLQRWIHAMNSFANGVAPTAGLLHSS